MNIRPACRTSVQLDTRRELDNRAQSRQSAQREAAERQAEISDGTAARIGADCR
jgi:hypothetical protein